MSKKFLSLLIFTTLISNFTLAKGAQSPEEFVESPPSTYAHLDPKRLINPRALSAAVSYYDAKKSTFSNRRYLTVIDFSLHSGKKRFFVVDLNSGKVDSYPTAHGMGSDPDHNGYANTFSNSSGTHASSLGAYKTAGTYEGSKGYSLVLKGLSPTNSKAESRAIVVHAASYVHASLSKMGRSWGCPALPTADNKRVINQIKGGSLMFAWTE